MVSVYVTGLLPSRVGARRSLGTPGTVCSASRGHGTRGSYLKRPAREEAASEGGAGESEGLHKALRRHPLGELQLSSQDRLSPGRIS